MKFLFFLFLLFNNCKHQYKEERGLSIKPIEVSLSFLKKKECNRFCDFVILNIKNNTHKNFYFSYNESDIKVFQAKTMENITNDFWIKDHSDYLYKHLTLDFDKSTNKLKKYDDDIDYNSELPSNYVYSYENDLIKSDIVEREFSEINIDKIDPAYFINVKEDFKDYKYGGFIFIKAKDEINIWENISTNKNYGQILLKYEYNPRSNFETGFWINDNDFKSLIVEYKNVISTGDFFYFKDDLISDFLKINR